MLISLAWKNIWRNKTRSFVVMGSVIAGLWVGAFILAYSFGMINQRLKDAIESEVSHMQVHHPDFDKDQEAKYFISNGNKMLLELQKSPETRAATARVITFGVASSAKASTGGKFIGILPEEENAVTGIKAKLIEGDYFTEKSKNKAIIGKKFADKLNVKLRSKIVLTFPDSEGNIAAGAFRIIGIYKSHNTGLDETNVYVPASDLSRLLVIPGQYHELAALVNQPDSLEAFTGKLSAKHPEVFVEDWKTLSPELGLIIDSFDQYMIIFLIIILLALSFGIINTMLMAVLERVREIGMLMAIGMHKSNIFGMIALETIMLVLLATPIGLLLSFITISYLGEVGMDMRSVYNEGYETFGFKSYVYPELEAGYYFKIMVMVAITAVLSAIYPAITATRLDPVEAMGKV